MPRFALRAIAAALALLAVAVVRPAAAQGYRIGPGDELQVNFLVYPDMNTKVTVGPDGKAVLPYISAVPVAGLTVGEANQRITQAYARVLREPLLETLVATYNSPQIYVGGQVRQPGGFPMSKGPLTTIKAVMLAGGLTPGARTGKVMVLRENERGVLQTRTVDVKRLLAKGGGGDNFFLEPGDIVFVPKTSLAEAAEFVQELKTALPVSFNYNFGTRY